MKAWPDWDEFVRRLREDAAFREEVRRQVLTEDLLNLPAVVRAGLAALTEQVRENSRQIAALTEALREFREAAERRFAAAEAQIQENSRQIAALTERMERAEAQIQENGRQIAALAQQVRENSRQIAENSRQIASLAEQVRENSRQIASLTERMDRVEAQIQENSRQIAENSRQIASLAEQVRENGRQIATLAEQVRALTKKTDDMDRTLSRHGQFVGVALEDRARDFLLRWLPTRSLRLLTPLYRVAQGNWEMDGVAEAEDPKGRLWLLVEVKGRLDRGDIRRFARKIRSSKVRAILRSSLGVRGRVQPWVWAAVLGWSAEEEARKAGVGLIEPRFGALVEPTERVWEDERP